MGSYICTVISMGSILITPLRVLVALLRTTMNLPSKGSGFRVQGWLKSMQGC